MHHAESRFCSPTVAATSSSLASSPLRPVRLARAALLLVALAGCATGEYSLVIKVSGGEKVHVVLGRGGPVPTEEDGIRIESTTSAPDAEKKNLIYTFEFSDAKSRGLQSVKVEDVSEETPYLLVEDAKPQLTNHRWRGVSRPLGVGAGPIQWVMQLGNTTRVFRFTLVFADGKKAVLHQGSMYGDAVKAGIRQMFGEKY